MKISDFLIFLLNTRFLLFQLPPGVINIFYEGIMEEVVFDERPMGLWNFVDGENNYVGALERYIQAGILNITNNSYDYVYRWYLVLSCTRQIFGMCFVVTQ